MPWHRCQFRLPQNAQADVPRQELKAEVAAAMRAMFNAANRAAADALLQTTIQQYASSAARLAPWLEANLPGGLMVCAFPAAHRRWLRTTNGLERVNQAIRRRTRVVGIFPNAAACLRLVSAIAMEISDEWETSKAYLSFSES